MLLVLATASAFISGPADKDGTAGDMGGHTFRQLHKGINTIIVDAGHGGHDTGAKGSYSQEKDLTLQIAMKLGRTLHESLPGVRIVMTRTTDIFQPVGEKAQIANDNHGDLFLCIHCDYMPKFIREFDGYRRHVYYTGKGANRKKHVRKVAEYRRYEVPDTVPTGTATFIFTARHANDKVITALQGLGEVDSDTTNTESTLPSSPEARIEAMMWAKNYFLKSYKLGTMIEDEMGIRNRGVEQRYVGIRVLESTNMPSVLVETGFLSNRTDEDYLNSDAGQQELADNITRAVIKYKAQAEGKTVEQVQDSAQANAGGLSTAQGGSQRRR